MSREGRGEIAARRRARELALQSIYQWLLHNAPTGEAGAQAPPARESLPEQPPQAQLHAIRELLGSATPEDQKGTKAHTPVDADFFTALLQGAVDEAGELRALFAPLLTRAVTELSPVEHALLLLGAFELRHDIETPYRVVINEAIELAKKYGGTDGHKFVNGVLDRLAASIRPEEAAAVRESRRQGKREDSGNG
ncbi:MAG: transcription antitermination factor NusB [Azoarcus sp.]|jgi:N utilization substance protein B|nr:transcription antitermination factor NusB [Azoarcus sp.]